MAMAAASSLPPGFGGLSIVRPHEQKPSFRLKRSSGKKVTWASGDSLCQIRMFLAEDAPFLAGKTQEQLQVKSSRFIRGATADVPPGFGSSLKVDTEALAASVVATVSWKCPEKVVLQSSWQVESGSESEEVEAQKLRESRSLEAVYPRASAIPHSPAEPSESCDPVDDSQIREIPVTAPDDDSDGDDATPASGGIQAVQGIQAFISKLTANTISVPGATQAPVAATPTPPPSFIYGLPPAAVQPSPSPQVVAPSPYVPGVAATGATTAAAPPSSSSNTLFAALSQAAKDQQAGPAIDPSLLLQFLANPSLVETLSGVRNKSMVITSNGLNVASPSLVAPPPPLPPNQPTSHETMMIMMNKLASSSSSSSPSPSSTTTTTVTTTTTGAQNSSPFSSEAYVTSSSSSLPGGGVFGNSSGPPGFGFGQMKHQQQQQFLQLQQQVQGGQQGGQQQQQQVGQQQQVRPRQNDQYFKDLIMQHGGKQQHTQGGKRAQRVCNYYNTPKGCRNGANCMFLHPGHVGGGGDGGAAGVTAAVKRPMNFMMLQQQHQQQQHQQQQQMLFQQPPQPKRMRGWSD